MTPPDVLVVGAGPAGSAAALVLARAGARVRMIERARFPRTKLCGDTLNPGALAILGALDVGRPPGTCSLLDDIRGLALPITGMMVTGPGGARITAEYPRGLRGLAVTRRDLDLRLVEAATAANLQTTLPYGAEFNANRFMVAWPRGTSPMRINEFVAQNVTGIVDENNQNEDWMELYNDSGAAVNAGGM